MRYIKYFSLIIMIAWLYLLCSCATGGNSLKIETSPSDKSLINLVSKIYDKWQLLEISKFNGSMNDLNAQYPVECLRENNGIYRASYLGEQSIAVLLFDNSGNKISGKIYSALLLKSDFDKLSKGQLLEEIRTLDPSGEYLFLYTGRNDVPKVSYHCTRDGYLITIEYDTLNTIISINKELI